MRWILSALFVFQMYLAMLVLGIVFFIPALFSPRAARMACKSFCAWVRLTARVMVGLRSEVRGPVPDGEVLIAAKHQSFLDIILIFQALPSARFIMKRELLFTPIIGQYAWRIGCIPVNRGKRGAAIARMLSDVETRKADPGQLVIYPQGTRIAPGVKAPYKVGTAALYQQMQQDCVPVATNVGVFWPRTGIYRKPGLAVVEFLPPIPQGLGKEAFLDRLETEVERESNRLMREAGFDAQD